MFDFYFTLFLLAQFYVRLNKLNKTFQIKRYYLLFISAKYQFDGNITVSKLTGLHTVCCDVLISDVM
jgi:hypothetical protein